MTPDNACFFNKLFLLLATLILFQSGEEQTMQQDSFEVLRNGKLFNRLQQNWCTMDAREIMWLGKKVTVWDVVAYHACFLEHTVT